jgi:hypothetical protein
MVMTAAKANSKRADFRIFNGRVQPRIGKMVGGGEWLFFVRFLTSIQSEVSGRWQDLGLLDKSGFFPIPHGKSRSEGGLGLALVDWPASCLVDRRVINGHGKNL